MGYTNYEKDGKGNQATYNAATGEYNTETAGHPRRSAARSCIGNESFDGTIWKCLNNNGTVPGLSHHLFAAAGRSDAALGG